MFNRLLRIRDEFGTMQLVRTILLFAVSVGMPAIGYFGFDSVLPAILVLAGFGLGWVLRGMIVDRFEYLSSVLPAAFIIYGIVLFVGEKLLGLSRENQVLIIAVVSVISFNIQFWSLSDPSIVNLERDE